MAQKLHMRDQVINKVDGIMGHYKSSQLIDVMGLIKKLIKKITSI